MCSSQVRGRRKPCPRTCLGEDSAASGAHTPHRPSRPQSRIWTHSPPGDGRRVVTLAPDMTPNRREHACCVGLACLRQLGVVSFKPQDKCGSRPRTLEHRPQSLLLPRAAPSVAFPLGACCSPEWQLMRRATAWSPCHRCLSTKPLGLLAGPSYLEFSSLPFSRSVCVCVCAHIFLGCVSQR